jgi:hypothetical protein
MDILYHMSAAISRIGEGGVGGQVSQMRTDSVLRFCEKLLGLPAAVEKKVRCE